MSLVIKVVSIVVFSFYSKIGLYLIISIYIFIVIVICICLFDLNQLTCLETPMTSYFTGKHITETEKKERNIGTQKGNL